MSWLAAISLVGCGGGAGTSAPTAPAPVPNALSISGAPAQGTAFLGREYRLAATLTMSDGTSRPATATWSSSNPSAATVDAAGVLRSVWPGTTTIAASESGLQVVTRISVRPEFSGRWAGTFTVTACASHTDRGRPPVFCTGSLFPNGSVFPITLDLGPVDPFYVNTGTLTMGRFSDPSFQAQGLSTGAGMDDVNAGDSRMTSPDFPIWMLERWDWSVSVASASEIQGDFRVIGRMTPSSGPPWEWGEFVGHINRLTRQ